jgi:hypothetical protein
MGSLLLNWGILVVGLIVFGFGCLWLSFYFKAYKAHVLRYGRVRFGKEYGTSWTGADMRGALLMISIWVICALALPGALLFFFTGLTDIGVPLWLGCTLGIAGILLFLIATVSSMGLAKQEAETTLSHMIEDEEQHEEEESE